MRSPLFLLLFQFVLRIKSGTSFQCGKSVVPVNRQEAVSGRIIGGIESKPRAWPWLVTLASPVENPVTNRIEPDFKCGGSLISQRHVLTAAHCSTENMYLARMGVNDLVSKDETPVDVLVESFINHDNFDANKAYNDIAIVLLKDKVEFTDKVRPICLPKEEIFFTSNFESTFPYVAGWGDTSYGSDMGSTVLREVQMPVVNLEHCKEVYRKFNTNVTDKNLCVGFEEGGKDACQGDSGGPLMIRSGPKGDTYYVIGVVSHGHGCALEGIPGVFTRVNLFLDWLNEIMARNKDVEPKKRPMKGERKKKVKKIKNSRSSGARSLRYDSNSSSCDEPDSYKKYHHFNGYLKRYLGSLNLTEDET